MEAQPSDSDGRPRPSNRRDRQRATILGLIADRHLHRAADLAHEHLAEFSDDWRVRSAVVDALAISVDPAVRRRATEFSR